MHVGLLIYGSLETLSGGYLYDRRLVEHLQSKGGTVELVSLPWRNYLRHLGDNLSGSLYTLMKELPVDLLLQDELNHPSLFWLNRRLHNQVSYQIIAIVHHLRSSERHPTPTKSLYRWVEGRYLDTVDGFIYNSQATRQAVERTIGKKSPGVVVHPGRDHLDSQISNSQLMLRAHDPGPLRLLFLGNVIPRKGLLTLLKALNQLPKNDWQLEVVGSLQVDPAYVREVRRYIEKQALCNNIKLSDRLATKELKEQMTQSQILAIPSSYEGFGIAYLEGMGYGLPAIASTAGGAGEIINHGQNGFLVKPGDYSTISRLINELHHDRDRLGKMSQAAQECYLNHPTWEQSVVQLESFLTSMVA